jgi:CRP-like cAMP-binding protein
MYPGEVFGEIALLCECKRTATVKTNTYSTLAFINHTVFKDMCQQFVDVSENLKKKMKEYNDKLKAFLKIVIKNVPYMCNLDDETINEITYHLKQKYFDKDDIIFRAGQPVSNLYLVTRGEVSLTLTLEGKDFIFHTLYQGCYLGGHKMLGDYYHVHSARAVNNVTLHCINKDKFAQLMIDLPAFKREVKLETDKLKAGTEHMVSFGLFRGFNADSFSGKDILKMGVSKIMWINRELKKAQIQGGINQVLDGIQIENDGEFEKDEPRFTNPHEKTHYLLRRIERKVDLLDKKVSKSNDKSHHNQTSNKSILKKKIANISESDSISDTNFEFQRRRSGFGMFSNPQSTIARKLIDEESKISEYSKDYSSEKSNSPKNHNKKGKKRTIFYLFGSN